MQLGRVMRNPLPDILEASEAAAKVIRLQRDLMILNQELRAVRQIKRAVWVGVSLILLNLMLLLIFYWIETALHEAGWSSMRLALLSALFFGTLIALTVFAAHRAGRGAGREP